MKRKDVSEDTARLNPELFGDGGVFGEVSPRKKSGPASTSGSPKDEINGRFKVLLGVLCKRYPALADYQTERRFRGVITGKRRWRFDYAWDHLKLAVELEGGVWVNGRHTRPQGYTNDAEKYNEAAIAGWRVLRFTVDMLPLEDGRAFRHLVAFMEASNEQVSAQS